MLSTQTEAAIEQANRVALPSLIGIELGKNIWEDGWDPYPFLLDMERELVPACMDRDEQQWFIINAPNQIGKSSMALLLIFWYIGMFPDRQVIFISYSDGFSHETGRKVRDLFDTYGEELFGLTVDKDNDSQGDWSLTGHPSGGMLSVGIGGQITGRQGHLVWIDDILRTAEEAASGPRKDTHWKEWQGTIWGRRQPGSVYVVSSTRFADDDLAGRLLKQQSEGGGIDWKVLLYPGLCWVPDDYEGKPEDYRDRLGRAPGDPLVTRFSKPSDTRASNWWVTAEKQLQNPQLFDCMVQQNPTNSDTGMFPEDRWLLIPRADWPDRYIQTRAWDIASTEGGGDYTCGTLCGKDFDGLYYIENVWREQVGPEAGIRAVKDTAGVDGYGVVIQIEEERSGAAKQLSEFYAQHLVGYMVEPAKTDGTKEQRAYIYSTLQKGRKVVLPSDEEDDEWVQRWIKSHKGMMGDGRKPKFDDEIDTGAYGIRWLAQHEAAEYLDPNDLDNDPAQMMAMMELLEAAGLA
jgi:phage terminase large subunit-like protein